MAIEHTICDACERTFPGHEEIVSGNCPYCGAKQGTHPVGVWGWLIVGAVLAWILWSRI